MPTATEIADAIATLVDADVATHGLREYYERNNVDIESDDLAKFVVSLKKPTVDMSLRRAHLKFPRVIQDHAKSGQLVADHFLPRGFQSFAYYSHTDNWSYEGRGMGFEKALRTAGRICT